MNARKKQKSNPARKTRRQRGIVKSLLIIGVSGVFLYELGLFLMVVWFNFHNPAHSAFMRATLTELRQQDPDARLRQQWVPYSQISKNLKRAVIASEDANFVDHDGVEWDAIRKAWVYNRRQEARGSSKRRGGSTITQQLAKNLFLSDSRTYLRKGQELILAYMIEFVMTKERILDLYLNVAQWGGNIFGAQAAAEHFYHTSAAHLSVAQAAQMASMLPNPDYYSDHRNSSYLRRHARVIEHRMRLVDIPAVH
jgi:monofunctional biosynthetic peptidoglycan transglycosylase